jgi:hypothetical protein
MDTSKIPTGYAGPVVAWIEGEFAGEFDTLAAATACDDLQVAALERNGGPVQLFATAAPPALVIMDAVGGRFASHVIDDGQASGNVIVEGPGWALFNGCEIQRDDESSVFPDDDAAIAHVRKLAALGDPAAQIALAAHDTNAAGGADE